MIDRENWARYSALLDEALDLDAPARAQWLLALRTSDSTMAEAMEKMLARLEPAHSPETPPTQFGELLKLAIGEPLATEAVTESAVPGQSFGPWQLSRKLGSGGMGEVWLATRIDRLYQGQAAIKLLVGGGDAHRLSARFARERNLLARLTHPGIARLLDAGISEGQSYLVLEYVEGQSLLDYARSHAPTVAARLRLALAIGRAVEYAHSRLIVHRDLKPSNVMVTVGGEVKLLDFGIAVLMEDAAEESTALTRLYGRGLTLDYAAPEQITGEPTGLGCDVFSLGAMLYELLTGQRPFRGDRLGRVALEYAVLHQDAPRLARAIAEPLPADAAPGSRPQDAHRVRGDLEAVIAKALRKAPEDRYPTMAAFVADLEHWLEHRPVSAGRDDWRYRSRLWLRRNRVVAALSAGIFIVLLTGLGLTLWQLERALRAEKRAEAAAATAEAVTRYFTDDLVDIAGASDVDAKTLTIKQLFEKLAARAGTGLAGQPQVETRVRLLLATLFQFFGDERADELAQISQAFDKLMLVAEHDPSQALGLLTEQDAAYFISSLSKPQLDRFGALLDSVASSPVSAAPGRRGMVMLGIAMALDAGQLRDSPASGLRRLDALLAGPPIDADQLWAARRARARMLWLLDRTAPSLAQYREVLADPLAEKYLGSPFEIARMKAQMGRLMLELGETEEAEKLLVEFAQLLKKTVVDNSIANTRTQLHLAFLREAQGRAAEAASQLETISPLVRQRIAEATADETGYLIEMEGERVEALLLAGRPAEALSASQYCMRAMQDAITRLGADANSSPFFRVRMHHAAALIANGETATARSTLADLPDSVLARQPEPSPIRAELLRTQAALAQADGDITLARQKLLAAEAMLIAVFNERSWRVLQVRQALARLQPA